MNIVITGGAGFIGRKLYEKYAMGNNAVYSWDIADNNISKRVDLLNYEEVKRELKECDPDLIFHCAGSASVPLSMRNPRIDYDSNVTGTHNLLFALHEEKKDCRIVFLSSAGIYGDPQCLPIREEAVPSPKSPYALHKLMCEAICEYCIKQYHMDIKIARIFSAYGDGLKKQLFWDMVEKYRKSGKLEMFGTGNESRDFIYIDDLINALSLLGKTDSRDCVFNIANGEETTIKEAVFSFADVFGINHEYVSFVGEEREGDPQNWRADISRLKAIGYSRTVGFREGVEKYQKWIQTLQL